MMYGSHMIHDVWSHVRTGPRVSPMLAYHRRCSGESDKKIGCHTHILLNCVIQRLETGGRHGAAAAETSLVSWELDVIRLKSVWRATGNCENIPSVQSLHSWIWVWAKSGHVPRVQYHVMCWAQLRRWGGIDTARAGSGQARQNTEMCDPGAGAELRSRLQTQGPAPANNAPGHWARQSWKLRQNIN